ncbi:PD-(D/E)XK nuclease family protein [Telmatobacter sp. DSM 110680]|uniref:PD-(D/E)XK nuclease family protein n=1 Tax=Telmatobacter sp. DSM 110680 TaxID=3036704 RepID=A0AAU7DLT9_9BACT
MDPFVDQLKHLCVAYPTRSKWVFVPNHSIGLTLGERIVLQGTNWLNLRFVTPPDIALRMGAPFLVERGIDPSEEGLGPALMMRLLLELPQKGGYFRPLADQPTMAQALWTTMHELSMAGIRSKDLKTEVFSSPAKHGELVALLDAYDRFLKQNDRGDMAAVYEEAAKHQDWCPIQSKDCWTELPDVVWSPLQRLLMDSMPGERLDPQAFNLVGVSVPRRLKSRHAQRLAADLGTNELAYLMSPPSVPARITAEAKIALFHAGGHEAEIEEVFRRILASGASLDQFEIACASDAHVALIWEKALRHNWPVTLGPGIPATLTRPGRALIGFCDWIETDFSAGHLRRLLESGDLTFELETEGFTAGQAAGLLARADAGWGRATYKLALERLHKSYESRSADPDGPEEDRAEARKKADRTSRVLVWVTALLASLPEPTSDGKVPLQAVVNGVLGFLERTATRNSALDHRAAMALQDYVSDLRALEAFSCSLSESLRFVRERVTSLNVAPERPRPGHLYACRLAQLGYAGRSHLFVVGLEEGRVFSSSTEDAILLDTERAGITADLRLSTDRIDEAVYVVLTRLAASGASVTFSYSCRDTREFRETYASWLMLQAFRLQRGDPSLSYHELKAALGEPKSAVPDDRQSALSPGAWWLRSVVGTGETGISVLGQTFTGVANGLIAEGKRQSNEFTEFDGFVPGAGQVLDPCAPEAAFSVTELEKAAECPFRFFLKRGLGVRPIDESERDKDVWLDPLTRGSELHELYAALLRRARSENRRANNGDGEWFMALAKDRLKRLNEEMPAATAEILERESRDFLADVALFLDAECAVSPAMPIGLEVSFGRPLDDDNEPLARPEAVEIDLGEGLTFRFAGRIDRIDKVGEASFEILDYKTGGFWRDKWRGVFDGGRRLQHALYGLAAAELLKASYTNPKITAGIYYFSSHRGHQERVRIPAPTKAAIAAVIGDLRDLIIKGEFVRTPDQDNCTYCDYAAACGEKNNLQAKNKQLDSKLEVYRKLTAHV